MNIKKTIPLLALLTLMLSACDIRFSIPFGTISVNSSTPIQSSTSVPSGAGYYRPASYSITQAQYNQAAGLFSLKSTGTQKILVIPVSFTDYPCVSGCTSRVADIQKAFFGANTDTGWESVASFYYRSSYGQLTLEGVVTPMYTSNMSTTEFSQATRTTGDYADYFDPTWLVVENAVAWYKAYSSSNLDEYDQDGDGFIDTVWLVYNNPNGQSDPYATEAMDDLFWAYTYWDYDNFSKGNPSNPVPMTYAWASYDFMYEGYGSSVVDAHTYIHETGHALGLDDYYSYTRDDWGAAGGLDMMDFNIVDHNAYSKFFLGWSNPFYVDGTKQVTTITLNPFESSGEFVLINDAWNGSAFDEYLAIEFYTPTGLNQKDSAAAYPGNGAQGFTDHGIKIYHVDSRLGLYDNNGFLHYTDTATPSNETYPYIAHSNSSEYSVDVNYRLLHLLEAGGVNTFKDDLAYATNETLFQPNDTFMPAAYSLFFYQSSGRFNDGTNIGYSIEITSMTSSEATLTITKL